MKQKKLLSVLLAGAMVVSGGSISGLEGIIPEVVAAASSTEWNGQPGVFQVNREAARSTFYSFDTAEKAKAKDRTKSSFYQLLNGDDWKFSWAVKPADRIGAKDANFNQKDYDDSSWDNITVPKSWQTYVNKDGSWKYDPVIYSNQNYPWMKNALQELQDGKCAYCELPLATRNPEIEHIAPKGGIKRVKHIECMFLPENLVYACHNCNSTECKGQKDTVVKKELPV